MLLNGTQSIFTKALLAREDAPSALRLAGSAETLALRFGVYRNNVFASLVAVLAARFPAVEGLVGADYFRAMASEFVTDHPPASPVMLEYGGGFAAFIASFGPAQDIPYLADVARFEWARHEATHAVDAPAISLDKLSALDPQRLGGAVITFHPAARLFASDYPVVSLWRINVDGAAAPDALSGAEAALIARPDVSALVYDLTPGAYRFLLDLSGGRTLEAALKAALAVQSDFDLPATLAHVFSSGAIASATIS